MPQSPVTPLPAASILLIRDTSNGLEVLMQERPKTMAFAPGAFVFPGGKVEESDNGEGEHGAFKAAAVREVHEEAGVRLDPDGLVLFAHWVTPEVVSLRFDTYFYLAHDKHNQEIVPCAIETVSTHWVSPAAILRDWEDERVPLMFPTRLNLIKLARWDTVEEAMKAAIITPVFTVKLELKVVDGVRTATIPKEAGYGVTHASQLEMSIEASKKR